MFSFWFGRFKTQHSRCVFVFQVAIMHFAFSFFEGTICDLKLAVIHE